MIRPYLAYLASVFLISLSCNPGNYDLATCDPNIKMLSEDACNVLNDKNTDCSKIYQCDSATRSCKPRPRDFDRDGDPDRACGGTDCNDYDGSISGINKLCGCEQSKIGQGCAVGVGACRIEAKYSCLDGALFCAMPAPMPDNSNYSATPDMRTASFDLNCDGKDESICADKNGMLKACEPALCTGTTFSVDSTPDQVAMACSTYCSAQKVEDCTKDHTFICNPNCGKPIHYCVCKVTTVIISSKCEYSGTPFKSNTVLCK